MRSILALGLVAIASVSVADNNDGYPYTIDPNSVTPSDRQTWCDNQIAQCPLICLQQPGVTTMTTVANDCDPDNLTYNCVCANNVAPNITQYSQTLPYYICTEWGNQCVKNCGNNNGCADDCRANHPCGAQHPNPPNSSILSMTTASKTASVASATAATTTLGENGILGATSTPGKGMASSMLNLGQSYGLAVVFASIFAGFAILL